jgi:hypothetical protein
LLADHPPGAAGSPGTTGEDAAPGPFLGTFAGGSHQGFLGPAPKPDHQCLALLGPKGVTRFSDVGSYIYITYVYIYILYIYRYIYIYYIILYIMFLGI